ncbi:MAG: hypothetical protein A2X25_09405 [Chloroflexi bacterium GWB2_49_20]|nr:MAG: hypothetical protein A2X25_09405 [Chloroflexi bacterium GWB2_49_20]OGN79360.1 MAG: hypothetical protein A2X26_04620 [Chloroflexi bacterium GWC2_49_37]OGN82870.1 MAG: hypothetical protein A2X27_08075 [Chloroflexi bacterium GWD2_49_16]HCC78523.1 MFS transporter [Anaerolineae bacterium]HCM97349.1 MFS transporter [Anaerolineae bacterium]
MIPDQVKSRFPITSILLLTTGFYASFLSRIALSPLLVSVELDLGIQHGRAGALFLLISTGNIISTLGSIYVSSRIKHHTILVISTFMTGIALLMTSLAKEEILLSISLIFLGLSTGFYLPSSLASLTETVDQSSWGKSIAIHEQAPTLAYISAPLLALFLLPSVQWRGIIAILGYFTLAVAFILLFYTSRTGRFLAEKPSKEIFKEILNIPSFWLIVILFSLGVGGNIGTYTMLPLYLTAEKGFDSNWVNTIIPLTRVTGFAVSFLSGYLADRFGHWNVLKWILIGSGVTIIFLGIMPSTKLLPILFLQPVWATAFFPPAFAALSNLASNQRRNFLVSLVVPLAFLVGNGGVPFTIGYFGQAGVFWLGFTLLGVLTIVAGLLMLKLIPEYK